MNTLSKIRKKRHHRLGMIEYDKKPPGVTGFAAAQQTCGFLHGGCASRKKNQAREQGFTLIEMAMVLVIVGVIVSVVASVLPSLIKSSKRKQARAVLEKVEYALQGYGVVNYRLPYADGDNDGNEDEGVYVGSLPYRTLGISASEDVWGNHIKYGVYEELATTDSSNLCSVLRGITTYDDGAKIHTTRADTGKIVNQAFILVSGGAKDLDDDGIDGFFDGLNEGTDPQFDDDKRLEFHGNPKAQRYDDMMRVYSLNEFAQKNCSGSLSQGDGSPASEICDNGVDDDGDGYVDCEDQDCFGVGDCENGGTDVTIITSTIPSVVVGSDYTVTFQASGGTNPYEWALTQDGGFSGFFLHTYTGQLSGSVDQCPGTYTLGIKVEDSTTLGDGGPTTDTASLGLQVTPNLTVARTSGSGTDVTWNEPTQEETFKANGGHVGDIAWDLDTNGASGFTVSSTATDTCVVKKNGTTTSGSYTFTLTATDESCPSNTARIIFVVTVTSVGGSAPYSVGLVAEWSMDQCSWDGAEGEVLDMQGVLHGTAQNGTTTSGAGRVCRAGAFTQSGHGIEIPDSSTLDLTGGDWSIAFWYYMIDSSSGGWDQVFVKGNGSRRNYAMWLRPGSGKIHFRVDPSNQGFDSNLELVAGSWYFIVGTYESGTLMLYINGTLDRSAGGIAMNASSANDDSLFIGKSPGYNTIRAKVDEFMLFSKALSLSEIDALFAVTHTCAGTCYASPVAEYRMENYPWDGSEGEVVDTGSGGSNGKAAFRGSGSLPTQTATTGGQSGRAAVFERVGTYDGGYLDLGDPADGDLDPGSDFWTVSAWIKWDGSAGDNMIYNKENLYEARVRGGQVQYAWRPHWSWDGGSSFPVAANTWTHVTTVYDGTEQILYKDGIRVFARSQTGSIGNSSTKLLIGARGSSNPYNFFGGMIDEVKIYNRALAENEIEAEVE